MEPGENKQMMDRLELTDLKSHEMSEAGSYGKWTEICRDVMKRHNMGGAV